MKYRSIILLALLLPFLSCSKYRPLSDYSENTDPFITNDEFEVTASLQYDASRLGHILTLSFLEGPAAEDYLFSFSFDGSRHEPLSSLGSSSSSPISSGASLSLSPDNVQSYLLPSLEAGSHSITYSVSRHGISRGGTLDYVVSEPLSIGFDRKDETSVLLTISNSGFGDAVYRLEMTIDGSPASGLLYNGVPIGTGGTFVNDFRSTKEVTFTIPYISSGSHTLTVTATSENGASWTGTGYFSFDGTEKINLFLEYNDYSHTLMVYSDSNPEQLSFTFRLYATIDTKTYYRTQYTLPEKKCLEKTYSGICDAVTVIPTGVPTAIDRGSNSSETDGGLYLCFYNAQKTSKATDKFWYSGAHKSESVWGYPTSFSPILDIFPSSGIGREIEACVTTCSVTYTNALRTRLNNSTKANKLDHVPAGDMTITFSPEWTIRTGGGRSVTVKTGKTASLMLIN